MMIRESYHWFNIVRFCLSAFKIHYFIMFPFLEVSVKFNWYFRLYEYLLLDLPKQSYKACIYPYNILFLAETKIREMDFSQFSLCCLSI